LETAKSLVAVAPERRFMSQVSRFRLVAYEVQRLNSEGRVVKRRQGEGAKPRKAIT